MSKRKAATAKAAGDPAEGAALAAGGFQIFDKTGAATEKQRVAVNLETGAAIETDGPGKYFLYVHGRQFPISSEHTLEELAGLPAAEEAGPADE
jgi:hypothetical protein